jgi:hypothetical protein
MTMSTELVKIFMRRGCSTGVSRRGVLDNGCHVALLTPALAERLQSLAFDADASPDERHRT